MFGPRWNYRFFVWVQTDLALAERNQCFTFDDDPVLAAALVHLETEPMTGSHFDAFDFVPFTFGEYLIHSPGAFISFDAHIANQFTPTLVCDHGPEAQGDEWKRESK